MNKTPFIKNHRFWLEQVQFSGLLVMVKLLGYKADTEGQTR